MRGNGNEGKLPSVDRIDSSNTIHLKFEKPTVSEYLYQVTHQERLEDKDTDSLCKLVWNAFACMGDSARNHMLKGLLERCSSNQIQFIRTRLATQNITSVPKGPTPRGSSSPKSTFGYDGKLTNRREEEKKRPSNVITANPSLYIRLLNIRYDHEKLNQHLQQAGLESSKLFLHLLSKRCQKIEYMIEQFSKILLVADDDSAVDEILRVALKLLDAQHATIYRIDDKLKCLVVQYSSWRKKREKIAFSNVLGATDVIEKMIPFSLSNIKSIILDFSDELANSYLDVELNCCLSVPIISENNRIEAIVEILDKNSGSPLFDAEDEYILKQLAEIFTLVENHNELKSEAQKRSENIQAVLKTASLMSTAMELPELIRVIMSRAQKLLSAERVSLFLIDKENQELWTSVAKGVAEIRIPINKGIAGYVATTGTTLNIPDAYKDPRFNKDVDKKTGFRTRNILCMPMRDSNGEVLGVTQVINKLPESSKFNQNDELLLEAFSALTGATIEKAVLFDKVQATLNNTNRVKDNLDTILKSITDVVVTLNSDGVLSTINHPDKLYLNDILEIVKSQTYRSWLKDNHQFLADIESVYETGQMTHCYDYELTVNGKKLNVNYTVIALQQQKQDLQDQKALFTRKPRTPKGHAYQDMTTNDESKDIKASNPELTSNTIRHNRGILLVIENISAEKRILSTLGRYMNSALANQILTENGETLKGQLLEASMVVSDIRGFREYCENMDPKIVLRILNEYFTHAVDAVLSEQGILDKYHGDNAIAIFGVPIATGDHAVRAVAAAYKMKSGLEAVNATNRKQGRRALKMGISISTGMMISGSFGPSKRMEYTALGENISISQILVQASKDYGVQIAIDDATQERIKDVFVTREIDRISTKKYKSVGLHEVIGPVGVESADEILEAYESYKNGLEEYRKQNWQEATKHFVQAVNLIEDEPSKLLIERIKNIVSREITLDENWNGAWPPAQILID